MKNFSILYTVMMVIFLFATSCDKKLEAADPLQVTYPAVYIIGNATSAAWNIAGAIEMTKQEGTKNTFVWTGDLKAGEIKFPTAKNFSSDSFMSFEPNQSINDNRALLALNGSPDQKWRLTDLDAGNYTITLDMAERTVTFQKNQ